MIKHFKDVDNLSPSDFEIFVKDVFLSAGWTDAVITQVGKEYKHGDGGVDIFAYKNKRKFAIEVKQRSINFNVDIKALNQLVTGAKLSNTLNMILVTNSYFTSEVKVRALRLGVELIDRDELQNLWVSQQSEIGRDIKPRKYQEEIIEESVGKYINGKSKLLIEMATGLGKTYTVALILKDIIKRNDGKGKVLFVAHQIEILLQSVTAFKNVLGIGNYSFSACFSGSEPEDTDFVFASFDTLYSQIKSLDKEKFDYIVIDEAHHTPARTYSEVVKHFKPKLLIGLTATPYRVDNLDVIKYFGGPESHIGKYDLMWGLRHNKLAFPKYMVMLDDLDDNRLNQLQSGLTVSDLDKRLFLHKKDEEVVRIVEKTIKDKGIESPKCIVFCRSIAHMKHLIGFFKLGTATMVHSKMLDEERRENIRKFRESDFSFILVCDLFNEGIDIPETNILVFMRYTGSKTIWLQQLGRGLRKTPNKEYVHVLDFVGSLERLNEVNYLQKSVSKVKVSREDFEEMDKSVGGPTIHDSTLEVTYNKSAAQVMKLIKELEYRLNSRDRLIEKLQVYVDENGYIPIIDKIEDELPDVTCDQISTHFDSYYRYVNASSPDITNMQKHKDKLVPSIQSYININGVKPSEKAVALNFKYKSLLEYTEQDIIDIVGNIEEVSIDTDQVCDNDYSESKTITQKLENDACTPSLENELSPDKVRLINKYAGEVVTSRDIQRLSDIEKVEIKEAFKSNFYFLSLVRNKEC